MQTKGVLKNLLLFALSGLVTPLPLSAASSTWDGGGANGNWTTAANWVGDVAPVGGSTDDLSFAGTIQTSTINNFANGTDFRNLTFDATAGAFTLAGTSRLDLFGSITNLSANLQTISLPLYLQNLNTAYAVNTGSGAGMTISGVIAGNTGAVLTKLGSSTLTLSAANTLAGGFDVAQGTLKMGNANANAYGSGKGNLSISNGAVFDVNGLAVRNNGLNGAGTILNSAAGNGSFQFGENNTGGNFSGNFTNTGAGSLALTKVGTGTVILSGQMSGNMGSALTISGGQLTLSNGFANNKSSTTELRITGGTLLSQEGASWSGAAVSSVSIGYSATSTASLLQVAGGNLNFGSGSFIIGAHASATGENKFLMTGGTVTQAGNAIRVGANNGGIMEVSGGVVNALAGIQFGSSGAATTWTTNAAFRLTGGEVNLNNQSFVLNAGNVPTNLTNQLILGNGTAGSGSLLDFRRFVTTGASAQAEIHFNGAKVVAGTSAGSDFLNALPGMTTSVKEGGVWVDTGSGSNSVTIAANLLSGSVNDGGLIKTGARTLNLSGTNTYRGSTQVREGTLVVSNTSFTATILSNSTLVNFATPPAIGTTNNVLSGPLDSASLANPSVMGLSSNTVGIFTNNPNLQVIVTSASTGPTFGTTYPEGSENTIGPNGLKNLMSYALGGTGLSSTPALPVLTSDGTSLTLTANIRMDGQGVRVVGQYAYDLAGPWTDVALTSGVPSSVANTTVRSFSQDVESDKPRKFLRFKAFLP
ncbi:Autotransporter-associated beta strand repeat [Candidatus Methylacidiphilaceae bacterium]